MRSRSLPYLARVGILVALYFSTAKLGLLLDAVSGFATAVWPPTGISLVALSLFGYRLWPGVALGAFLANAAAARPPPPPAAWRAAKPPEPRGAPLFRAAGGGSPPRPPRAL